MLSGRAAGHIVVDGGIGASEPARIGLSRRFNAALPWRWEVVRPFDRYGEPMSPEFATEALAREHARRVWGG